MHQTLTIAALSSVRLETASTEMLSHMAGLIALEETSKTQELKIEFGGAPLRAAGLDAVTADRDTGCVIPADCRGKTGLDDGLRKRATQ